jgi:hypothetical protein
MITLLLALSITSRVVLTDNVDLAEVNHFYADGKLAFTQLIFWDWCNTRKRYVVRQWQIVDDPSAYSAQRIGGMWKVRYFDREYQMHRIVTAKFFRSTHTDIDPERVDRDMAKGELDCRVPLSKPISHATKN